MNFDQLYKILSEAEARERNAEKRGAAAKKKAKKKKKRKIANASRKANRGK